jgi:vancomycin resistance protein YoaR
MSPTDIAKALTFRADPMANPKMVAELTEDGVSDSLKPQLSATEKPGRDATLDFATGAPVVVPSQDGRGIDYAKTINALMPVLTKAAPRQITAVYADQPAKVTTEDINKMGITGEISTFTTGGFAADSGQNIKRAAEQINGTIVKPGETFSLNAVTNPRTVANGYVEAGIIEDGHPARGVGGGVSQVATTTYNAAYFAGMVDVAHKEHSFYISRYPVAREATVFDNVIDLKFRNDGPTAVMIRTIWTPSSLTVKLYGTKRYEVTSTTGPRTNETPPTPVTIPKGQPCSPSQGAPGFTASDTRTLKNLQTGEVTTQKRTVKYNPSPIVICGS